MTTRRQFLGHLGAATGALVAGCGQGGGSSSSVAPPPPPTPPVRPTFYVGVGIENSWLVQADPVKDGTRRALDELALTGHDAQWREDFQRVADLGVNSLRYGLPWPRLEASPGVYDFSELRTRLEALRALGITPILDLIHYGTPAWMGDGLGDAGFPEALERYATALGRALGGLATHFTPYNEPQVAAALCGAVGRWPPYAASGPAFAQIGVRVGRAMVLASQALRAAVPGAKLVSAESINWALADTLVPDIAALPAAEAEDLRGAIGSFPASHAYGKVSPDHRFSALLVSLGIPRADLEWLAAHAAPPDVIGYNHYPDIVDFPTGPDFTRGGSVPLATAADEAASKVEAGLRRARAYFGRDVYLTETSAGLLPESRAAYVGAVGRMAQRLRAEAFPLVGLNWWPLVQAVKFEYREEVGKPLSAFFTPGEWNNALYDVVPQADGSLRREANATVPAMRALAAALR